MTCPKTIVVRPSTQTWIWFVARSGLMTHSNRPADLARAPYRQLPSFSDNPPRIVTYQLHLFCIPIGAREERECWIYLEYQGEEPPLDLARLRLT